jgi:hypothetical protein
MKMRYIHIAAYIINLMIFLLYKNYSSYIWIKLLVSRRGLVVRRVAE